MRNVFLSAIAVLLLATVCRAADVEQTIPAKDVAPGATVLEWTADADATLSGFYLRLANCVPPMDEPIVAALFIRGERLGRTVVIPAFKRPLLYHTRPAWSNPQTFPPLDVGREFRRSVAPIALKKGDAVSIVVESCEPNLASGLVAGLQFQGKHNLADDRAPFREARTNGPVCSIQWSEPEVVTIGSGEKFDPLCAPQNNSSVIADADGTLYIFSAFYSVDEQYGGGRGGSYSRIYGYKKAPGADAWEPIGLVVDVLEGQTYSGDPFVFRDLDGTPCILFSSVDGTNGFADWRVGATYIQRSTTDSFAGPWAKPFALWRDYPQYPDDKVTGGRANCVRIYPRAKTQDYLVVWNHGSIDMDVRGLIVKDLTTEISYDTICHAPMFVRNQEEGGGGFTLGDKGYYSTWQIPWLNDPNGLQRVYEIDLNDGANPEAWRVVPGSLGCNDGANPKRDGGTTADAWAISVAGGRLWATSCEYSATENKNYLYARSAPIEEFEKFISSKRSSDVVFRYGAVRPQLYHETFPTIERAVGENCSLELDFRSFGELAYAFIFLGASDAPESLRSVQFEFNKDGARFVAYENNGFRIILAESPTPRWEPGKKYRLKLVREGAKLTGYVDGVEAVSTTVTNDQILASLNDEPRFRLYGWEGGSYEISNAVLTDGKE